MRFSFKSQRTLFLLLGVGLTLSQNFAHAQTARELLDAGSFAFSSQDYAKAEDSLNRFIIDYGSSPEAAQSLEAALRLLGVSQLKLEKFPAALPTLERYLKAYPQGEKAEEFTFWIAVAQMKTADPKNAYDSFTRYLKLFPRSVRAVDARFSMGLCLFQEDKFKEVVEYYPPIMSQLNPDQIYQANILRLYCLLQLDKLDEAFTALGEIDPQSEAATKVVAYHLLALDLGSKLLDKDSHRQALSVLQRVYSKTRLLTRQQGKLENLKVETARLSAVSSPESSFQLLRLKELTLEVEKEVQALEKMKDYDTALQFRIGQCFFELGRPRETYLSMKGMLERLPDTDLLANANYTMLICLTRMERWDEAIQASFDYEKRFAKNKELPNVIYLRAESYQRLYKYQEAYENFMALANRFPDHAQAHRSLFLAGYALLMKEQNADAYQHFEKSLKDFPKSPFSEQSLYWQSMALHFSKDYARSREAFAEYLKKYPKGAHEADVVFRRAQALFNQKLFTEAYKELEDFLKKYAGSAAYDEACNLLGDTYLALGETDRGLAAYKKVSGKDSKLYDYGIFRMGLAYKALEQFDVMLGHFKKFAKERSNSPRLSEALGQIAWVYRRLEQPEKAKEIYWEAVKDHGNDEEAAAVEDMLHTLAKMYRQPDEQAQFTTKLNEIGEEAVSKKRPTLAARAYWMRAALLAKINPSEASQLLLTISDVAQPRELSPRILADVGDELRKAKKNQEAELYYKTILSWYPLSMLKDRAYAGLGLLAWQKGETKEALDFFVRFEKESIQSPLLADVLQARASIYQEKGKKEEAVKELERILEVKSAKGRLWVEALYRIGEIRLQQKDPKRAIPYFQRIYVMYARWTDMVAKSYWQSGQAFEQLEMKKEAFNTYKEFIEQPHLKETPEYRLAEERIKLVGGA